MEQITLIYFQNEHNLINNIKAKSDRKEFYYAQDFRVFDKIPNHRR